MILISGASKGIGKYLFHAFKENNEDVIGLYHQTKPEHFTDQFYKLDVANFDEVNNVLTPLLTTKDKIILINCAGINYNSFAHKADPKQWENVIKTNLVGTFNVIRVVLPYMRKHNFGRIVNFSSVVASSPTPGVSSYASSKSALWGLSKSVAVENASKNITINNINMGYSELGMISEVPKKFLESIINQIPIGKLCPPEDIFSTVEFLIKNSYITGASIDLNGGII